MRWRTCTMQRRGGSVRSWFDPARKSLSSSCRWCSDMVRAMRQLRIDSFWHDQEKHSHGVSGLCWFRMLRQAYRRRKLVLLTCQHRFLSGCIVESSLLMMGPILAYSPLTWLSVASTCVRSSSFSGRKDLCAFPSPCTCWYLVPSCIGYIGDFELVDDRRAGKIVVELNGRINKCAVISPRYDIAVSDMEKWTERLLPSRQVRWAKFCSHETSGDCLPCRVHECAHEIRL